MSPTLTKNLKRALQIVALALLASLVLRVWHATDDEANESRAYISTNEEIKSAVGDIVGIDFKKKVTYQGTPSDPAFVEFTYFVRGNSGDILTVVRGYGEPTKYNVHRIQNL